MSSKKQKLIRKRASRLVAKALADSEVPKPQAVNLTYDSLIRVFKRMYRETPPSERHTFK